MDFLILPPLNSQMTDDQLVLWQYNALGECECENFFNRRIEANRQERDEFLSNYAINSAIEQHGLRRRRRRSESSANDESHAFTVHLPTGRGRAKRLYIQVYESAMAEAIIGSGLVLGD